MCGFVFTARQSPFCDFIWIQISLEIKFLEQKRAVVRHVESVSASSYLLPCVPNYLHLDVSFFQSINLVFNHLR